MHPSMNRRDFLAATTAAAATSVLAHPTQASSAAASTEYHAANLPRPALAHLKLDPQDPHHARLSSRAAPGSAPKAASLSLKPLACQAARTQTDSSFCIELYHPGADRFSILYAAHSVTNRPNSIPAHPAGIRVPAPSSSSATLRITQRIGSSEQITSIRVPLGADQSHILAIPTSGSSSSPAWRFTHAKLDEDGQPSTLTNQIPGVSSRCVYMSITAHA